MEKLKEHSFLAFLVSNWVDAAKELFKQKSAANKAEAAAAAAAADARAPSPLLPHAGAPGRPAAAAGRVRPRRVRGARGIARPRRRRSVIYK